MARRKMAFHNRIYVRILAMLLILFTVATVVVGIINANNIRSTYEQNYTERVLLTNALMADSVSSGDVEDFVELMTNQDDAFKARQVQYYYDRLELWDLPEDAEPDGELLDRMAAFREETNLLKNDHYWEIIDELKRLAELSNSAYLYVMADTGLMTRDGEILYTFIFANDDEKDADFDADGLGTSDTSLDSILSVYETKQQMDRVEYYNDVYGELYYAYAPIINDSGEVIAVFGTDIDLSDMNASIAAGTLLTNILFLVVFAVIIFFIFFFLHLTIVKPLKGLTDTANELAEGNIYAKTPESALKQHTEIGTLASAVNDMSLVYQDMVKNAADLFSAAKIGRLDIRNDTSRFKGDMQNFIMQTNDTLDAMMLYLNSIPESIFIMNKDLDIYFSNENYNRCFCGMSGAEFMSQIFMPEGQTSLKECVSDALNRKNHNTVAWINGLCYSVLLKEIVLSDSTENSVLIIAIDITDLVNEKENAQAATKAKSGFLSRMSHEMRTPMNAIIGMTKIAENSDDIGKLRYCITNIGISATHLLGIINDVLDMSKIEAGKFELDSTPINIEKILMNVCNIVIDNMEKKRQKFNVTLDKGLGLNYIGDGLRLSQVITNLLSNAVKFTPEEGKITLSVKETGRRKNSTTLRFSVTDTGIGMSDEQISRLFGAFEQADGSVSRKYGGTGLGLAISKNIVEKMGGRIWVESTPGAGSNFVFEVNLEKSSHQNTVIFDGIRPEDLRLLVIESDADTRMHFLDITRNFGINTDTAGTADEAMRLVDAAGKSRGYDIIFLAYDLPSTDAIDLAKRLASKLDKNTVIIITTFLEWRRIEKDALQNNITRYITKPFFPSSILDAINDTVGTTLKTLDIKKGRPRPGGVSVDCTQVLKPGHNSCGIKKPCADAIPDFSSINILLAEDVEINREIFIALLGDTKISVDCAENGQIAVSKFQENPDKYDLIIMDIQMPEMDGFVATRTIRSMNTPKAKNIPIVAMTANAFKEDIDRCLEAGMNDHLAKPIDEKLVIEKIARYTNRNKK